MIPATDAVRVQLFFSDKRMEWSEIFWAPPGTTIDAAFTEARTTMAAARTKCLARDVALTEIRASVDNIFRDSLVSTYVVPVSCAGGHCAYTVGMLGCGPAAPPTECLRLREEAGSLFRRITYFSGVPDSVIVDQGNWSYGSTSCGIFDENLQDWLIYLRDSIWGFVGFAKPPAVSRNVTGVSRGGPVGAVTILYDGAADNPFPLGSTVQLSRMRNSTCCLKLNGKWEVQTVSPGGNSVGLNVTTCGSTCAVGGVISSVTRSWHKFTRIIPDGWAIHKRGGAELSPRGRLRNRRPFGA